MKKIVYNWWMEKGRNSVNKTQMSYLWDKTMLDASGVTAHVKGLSEFIVTEWGKRSVTHLKIILQIQVLHKLPISKFSPRLIWDSTNKD